MIEMELQGARVMRPTGWSDAPLAFAGDLLVDQAARKVNLSGYDVLPGIIDVHGDGFERHMAPRRGALRERDSGIVAVAAELAASGISTAVLAQFWSWEGGMRGPDFAQKVFTSIHNVKDSLPVDLHIQLRFETHYLDALQEAEEAIDHWGIRYVVFNDHLPHDRLSQGRKPSRLTGQALKSGRSPEAHLEMMNTLHTRTPEVGPAMDAVCARLAAKAVVMGSHDDHTVQDREIWRARGAKISEFPETMEAAQSAKDNGEWVILGAPNVVRGASHAGNISAQKVIAEGLCDALASDYHYPSPARAAWRCVEKGLCDEVQAWRMLSEGPAQMLGLTDRGRLEVGKRADFVVMDPQTRRIVATFAGGQVAWMSGEVAARFMC